MGRENKFERKTKKKSSPRKDSPGLEDYHTPPESNENECKKCGREIDDRSHQTNGKHKYRCIECYYERKAKKRSDREEEKSKYLSPTPVFILTLIKDREELRTKAERRIRDQTKSKESKSWAYILNFISV